MTNNQLTDEQIAQWLSVACMVIGDRFATVDELSAANAIRSLAVELQERRKAAMDNEPVAHNLSWQIIRRRSQRPISKNWLANWLRTWSIVAAWMPG